MRDSSNDNIHAICQIVARGCRESVTRICAILHTMDEGSAEAGREAMVRALAALDNDLRGLEKWLGMVSVGAEEEEGKVLATAQGLREAEKVALFCTAPKKSRTGLRPQETPAIVVHPPPGWAQVQFREE